MGDNNIDELIEELTRLRIQESELQSRETMLLQQILTIATRNTSREEPFYTPRRNAPQPYPSPPPPSAPFEPRERQTPNAVAKPTQQRAIGLRSPRVPDSGSDFFRPGDHVEITNDLRVTGRAPTRADRFATVVRITNKRVFVETDSGTHTNRVPHHLSLVD